MQLFSILNEAGAGLYVWKPTPLHLISPRGRPRSQASAPLCLSGLHSWSSDLSTQIRKLTTISEPISATQRNRPKRTQHSTRNFTTHTFSSQPTSPDVLVDFPRKSQRCNSESVPVSWCAPLATVDRIRMQVIFYKVYHMWPKKLELGI